MIKTILTIVQIFFGITLVLLILLQGKGTGFAHPFLGNIGTYSTRRGVEKAIFYLTIIFAVLFFLSSIAQFSLG